MYKSLSDEELQILYGDIDHSVYLLNKLITRFEGYEEELDTYKGIQYHIESLRTVEQLCKIHIKKLLKRKEI